MNGGPPTASARLAHRIVSIPWVYDLVQMAAGVPQVIRRLQPALAESSGLVVCEVGAGTGNLRAALPPSAKYLGLDNDPVKLAALVRKRPADWAVLGDGAALCVKDKGVDYTLCVCVSHHLTDEQLHGLLLELRRVTRRKLVFLDPVRRDRVISRILWKYDRGRNPRTVQELSAAVAEAFRIESVERFTIFHEYFLCEASPK